MYKSVKPLHSSQSFCVSAVVLLDDVQGFEAPPHEGAPVEGLHCDCSGPLRRKMLPRCARRLRLKALPALVRGMASPFKELLCAVAARLSLRLDPIQKTLSSETPPPSPGR